MTRCEGTGVMMAADKKKPLLIAVGAVTMMAAGIVVWICAVRKPRPVLDRPESIAKFAASRNFRRLSAEEQKTLMRKMRPEPGKRVHAISRLSAAERRQLRENMTRLFRHERRKRLEEYFALKTRAEKNAYLDRELARMDHWRRQWETRRRQTRAAGKAPGPRRPRPPEAERIARRRTRLETTAPEERAMRDQYRHDLQTRARKTGKSFGRRR